MSVSKRSFGTLQDGRGSSLYTIENRQGCRASITDFGAALVSLVVPDKQGRMEDVVLGFDCVTPYEGSIGSMGAVCGRFANRIARASLPLNRKVYPLPRNDGPNTLHGGLVGFHHRLWTGEAVDQNSVRFTYLSPDGEEGFPGELLCAVTYRFSEDNVLSLTYEAAAKADTVANLTNHSYFNLDGAASGTIYDHSIRIHASRFTPITDETIPTGELAPVKGVFDLRAYRTVREGVFSTEEQIAFGTGYDHNFVLDGYDGKSLFKAVDLKAPVSGRRMEVWTTLPGIQLYTGNFIRDLQGKEGIPYHKGQALCLETQFYPDCPHHPAWPQAKVCAGETQRSVTEFRFFRE
ncbi:MAG: galactose mutarotase [Clostridia bacterium]|nr:galactose mutarotase [Clostridia bacterium]